MKKIILTLTLAATTVLAACGTTEATTTSPTTVTVTATPTPTGDLRSQFQDAGLMVLGLDNATIEEAGEALCEARDAGAPHRLVAGVALENLGEFYTASEVETALGIWYINLCPEYA